MREKLAYILAAAAALLLVRNLYLIFMVVPDEAAQGMIYRLLYFHVPAWWTAFLAVALSGVFSTLYLIKGNLRCDAVAMSITEVAVVFLIMGITLGSIWGRIIWGVWWAWDARLTSPVGGGARSAGARSGRVLAVGIYRCAGGLVLDPLVAHAASAADATTARNEARLPVELAGDGAAHRGADADPDRPGGDGPQTGIAAAGRTQPVEVRVMDKRNLEFMFYGFTAAWLIVFGYVFTLLSRARRIRGEIKRLETMLDRPS
jgi:CcmD family protein